jgi:hypothetical protein
LNGHSTTYNIGTQIDRVEKVEISIGTLVIADKEIAEQIAQAIARSSNS